MSTVGATAFVGAGSGVLQALSLPEDQGSKRAELLWAATDGGFDIGAADLGVDVGAERLNAESMLVDGAAGIVREETFVGGAAGDTGDAEAKPENSSEVKRSFDRTGATDLDRASVCCVKSKLSPFDGARVVFAGAFDTAGGFEGARSKKPPPLRGGEEATWEAEGVDFGCNELPKPPPLSGGGDMT